MYARPPSTARPSMPNSTSSVSATSTIAWPDCRERLVLSAINRICLQYQGDVDGVGQSLDDGCDGDEVVADRHLERDVGGVDLRTGQRGAHGHDRIATAGGTHERLTAGRIRHLLVLVLQARRGRHLGDVDPADVGRRDP